MPASFSDPAIQDWFTRRTFAPTPPDPAALAAARASRGLSIGVALPALNEAATIGSICSVVREELGGLVDRLVVMDSGSSDDTAGAAHAAGAEVYDARTLDVGGIAAPGKGGALWKSLAVLDTDLVVWIDSDIKNFEASFVTKLIAPLLADDSLTYIKGYYERPIHRAGKLEEGGARVTEIAARPLLNMLAPHLAGIIQPLSGESAGRRAALMQVPFLSGYAVDVGLLIDVAERFGIDAIAQVDLGVRVHANKDVVALGRMAHQVIQGIFTRLEDHGVIKLPDAVYAELVQFDPEPRTHELEVRVLPPLVDLVI